jgi:hypothetical protein
MEWGSLASLLRLLANPLSSVPCISFNIFSNPCSKKRQPRCLLRLCNIYLRSLYPVIWRLNIKVGFARKDDSIKGIAARGRNDGVWGDKNSVAV